MGASKRHAERQEESEHLESTINTILEWSEEHPEFDPDFIVSVKGQLERFGDLTDKQKGAVYKIWERFGIEDWYYLKNQ